MGNVTAIGDVSASGNVTADGDVTAQGDFSVQGDVGAQGDIRAEGNLSTGADSRTQFNELDGATRCVGGIHDGQACNSSKNDDDCLDDATTDGGIPDHGECLFLGSDNEYVFTDDSFEVHSQMANGAVNPIFTTGEAEYHNSSYSGGVGGEYLLDSFSCEGGDNAGQSCDVANGDGDCPAGSCVQEGVSGSGTWMRVAVGRQRTSGLFTLKDRISGGGHSYLKFRAGRSYHNQEGTALNILQHSRYGSPTFGALRICHNGRVYDQYFLDVYVQRPGQIGVTLEDNTHMASRWVLRDWEDLGQHNKAAACPGVVQGHCSNAPSGYCTSDSNCTDNSNDVFTCGGVIGATSCSDDTDCDASELCAAVPKECVLEAKAYTTNHYVEADVVFAVGNDETRLSVQRDGTVEVDRQLVVDQDSSEDGHPNLALQKGNNAASFISMVRDNTESGGDVATGDISLSSNYLTLDASQGMYLRTNDGQVTAMRINPDGRVAMGQGGAQAEDGYRLDVAGNVRVEGEGQNAYMSVVRTQETGDTEVRIQAQDGSGKIGTTEDLPFQLMTNGTARMSISGGGVTDFTWGVNMNGGADVADGLDVAGGLQADTVTASQEVSAGRVQINGVDDASSTGACGAANLGLMRMFRSYEAVYENGFHSYDNEYVSLCVCEQSGPSSAPVYSYNPVTASGRCTN